MIIIRKNHFAFLLLVILSLNCNPGKNDETAVEEFLKRKLQTIDAENFQIPDSIDTDLIIAVYSEEEPRGNTLLIYDSANSGNVTKVKYLADNSTQIDHLKQIKFNEFRSLHYNMEYIVNERSVTSVYREKNYANFANPSATKKYTRLDTNRVKTKEGETRDITFIK